MVEVTRTLKNVPSTVLEAEIHRLVTNEEFSKIIL